MRSPRTTGKSSPRSPQLEKARTQQQRPNAAKKKSFKTLHRIQSIFWPNDLQEQRIFTIFVRHCPIVKTIAIGLQVSLEGKNKFWCAYKFFLRSTYEKTQYLENE